MRRFENEMEALREYDHNAHKWVIDNTNPSHWSRSHFKETTKCDILLNNLCESFNSVILETREKPIRGMLENIRVYLMERLRTKREWMKKRADNICPKIQIKLEKAKAEYAANIARQSDDKRFEVTHIYGETYVVDLDRCSCTCRRWQLTGLPCCHAIACISFTEATPEQYVHKCYSRDAYLAAYEPAIAPISGPNAWKASIKELVLPPKKIRLPGRPKKARRREPDESRKCSDGVTKLSRVGVTSLSCSKCHEKGHTIRKCPLIIPQEQLNAHGSGRGPSLNTNRCSNCQVTGHNRRTCPQVHRREQESSVTGNFIAQPAGETESEVREHHASQGSTVEKLAGGNAENDSCAEAEVIPSVESLEITPSAPSQVPELMIKKMVVKCSFCRALGHNRKTCPTKQAQA